MIEVSVDMSEVEALASQLGKVAEGMPAAISRALNRAGDQATTAIGRQLAEETGMHVRDVRDAITQDKSTPGTLEYTITISGEFQPLSQFDPHQTSGGISARPWGERRHVFVRMGRARFPIRDLWGPSLVVEATRGQTAQVTHDTVAETFPRRLAHEVERLLGKSGGDGGDE